MLFHDCHSLLFIIVEGEWLKRDKANNSWHILYLFYLSHSLCVHACVLIPKLLAIFPPFHQYHALESRSRWRRVPCYLQIYTSHGHTKTPDQRSVSNVTTFQRRIRPTESGSKITTTIITDCRNCTVTSTFTSSCLIFFIDRRRYFKTLLLKKTGTITVQE